MSARQLIDVARKAGLSLIIDGRDLVVEADGSLPEPLIAELRRHKPDVIAALTESVAASAPFSGLYATEADYARRLLAYARQDGLSLTVKDGRLIIAIGSKSDVNLVGDLRAHESAVIEALVTEPGFRPPIVKVPPFGCDAVPERFKAAWEAMLAQCPPGVRPIAWQTAIIDAADLFGHWGSQLVALGFTPNDLFAVPRHGKAGGLAWFMRGSPAMALDDVLVIIIDGDGELVLSQVFPDVLHRIELWRVGRQRQKGDVVWGLKTCSGVVSSTVEGQDGVRSTCDLFANLGQMKRKRFGVGVWQDKSSRGAPYRTHRPEDAGPFVAQIARRAGPRSLLCPNPCQRALLANARDLCPR
jgi:hypothetical protein